MSYKKWIEIDLNSIRNNIIKIKNHLKKNTLLIPILKSNSYGFGLNEISKLLINEGFDLIGLSDQFEGKYLKEAAEENLSIFILTPPYSEESFRLTINNNFIQGIDSYNQAKILNELAANNNKVCKVHIKVNVGLNRYGLNMNDLIPEIKKILKLEWIEVEGLYTHFSTQYSDIKQIKKEFDLFINAKNQLISNNIKFKYYHCANGTVAFDFPNMQLDAVRVGFSLFNYSPGLKKNLYLENSFNYKSKINKIRRVSAGECIGYDKKYKTESQKTIAIVPVGYADGIPTSIANEGSIIVNGSKVRIIGNVCMTQIFVDITDLNGIKKGDEVTLIGKQKNNIIRAEDIGAICNVGEAELISRIYYANKNIKYINK